jgi:hypothetical protein
MAQNLSADTYIKRCLNRNILFRQQFISAQSVHQFWNKSQHPVFLVVNQYFIVLISRVGKVKGADQYQRYEQGFQPAL